MIDILLGITFVFSIIIAILLGLALAATQNLKYIDGDLTPIESALPTQIFDRHGELITEFFSNEKRKVISIDEVPDHLLFAIMTREDRRFFEHNGFDFTRLVKAAFDIVRGQYSGGASTITQQVAGNRYADRRDISISRKLVELWYSIQLERYYTKQEILEFYINEIPFGGGTNGVEAASQFYFHKSARDITIAESVLLANVIARHSTYSPLKNPNIAKERQEEILSQMVELGYTTQEEADQSFHQYWQGYDGTRASSESAWGNRNDKAPWFSWYLTSQLEELHLSADDIWKGGLKVYTTLDLEYQSIADEYMAQALKYANETNASNTRVRSKAGDKQFLPIIDLLALGFNLRDLRTAGSKEKSQAKKYYRDYLNPLIDVLGVSFNRNDLKDTATTGFEIEQKISKRTEIEGALVSLDSHTGHILAMIGGSSLDSRTNWFNRAVDGHIQPGSSFKPLYYSAAINLKKFDAASLIIDRPVVFENDDGTPYIPENFKGEWVDYVLLRNALAHSMNVPSLKVLEAIGFDAAIDQASKLLGISDPIQIEKTFPRKFPLGLGIINVSPLQMAKAYATFPNGGKEVVPISVRYIEDRYGKIILEPEKQMLNAQKRKGNATQLMSPQAAFVMTNILQGTVKYGTLSSTSYWNGGWEGRPVAGKTGTTQNWSDAWTCGFTNQVTTTMWFGFDQPGNSLGTNMTGATLTGKYWGKYMKRIHEDMPNEEFTEPATGIRRVTVCELSGDLPDPEGYCNGHTYEEVFIEGTQPRTYCELHKKREKANVDSEERIINVLDSLERDGENPFKLWIDEEEKQEYMDNQPGENDQDDNEETVTIDALETTTENNSENDYSIDFNSENHLFD